MHEGTSVLLLFAYWSTVFFSKTLKVLTMLSVRIITNNSKKTPPPDVASGRGDQCAVVVVVLSTGLQFSFQKH